MVHEIKEKNLFQIINSTAREIGLRTVGAYAFLGLFLVVICITFLLTQTKQNIIQSASYDESTRTFSDTFDANPSNPQPFTQLEQNDWDVQIHSRDSEFWHKLQPMEAMHSSECAAPPASHHLDGTYENSVFRCKNHVMTSIHSGGGYAVIYLTPNHMADFTNGPAIITFDMSTEKMSSRDWWDVTVSPFNDAQALPLLSDLSQGVDLQKPNANSVVITTDNGEGSPNLKVVRNGQVTGYPNPFFNFTQGIAEGTNQMAARQPFKLTVSKTHIRFERLESSTATPLLIIDKEIPALSWTKGVVQFGHHSYNPEKDNSGKAATWHWDSFTISPSIPFTMIKANKRIIEPGNSSERTITFNSPAPANSYLRFSGICKISVDGTYAVKMTNDGHPEHMSSYMVPIQTSKQSFTLSFSKDDWYENPCIAKDFAIWSLNTTNSTNPTPTTQPTITSIPPTLTPTIQIPQNTPTVTPIPTNTPTLTPTKTPTPTLTPTNTPSSQPSIVPTKTPQQKSDINGSGKVDIQDLSYLLTKWGTNDTLADINSDGIVNITDLSIILSNWNQ